MSNAVFLTREDSRSSMAPKVQIAPYQVAQSTARQGPREWHTAFASPRRLPSGGAMHEGGSMTCDLEAASASVCRDVRS